MLKISSSIPNFAAADNTGYVEKETKSYLLIGFREIIIEILLITVNVSIQIYVSRTSGHLTVDGWICMRERIL